MHEKLDWGTGQTRRTQVSAQADGMPKANQPAALHSDPGRAVQLGPYEEGPRVVPVADVRTLDEFPGVRRIPRGEVPTTCARTGGPPVWVDDEKCVSPRPSPT